MILLLACVLRARKKLSRAKRRRASPSSPAAEKMGLEGSVCTVRRFSVADLRPCALARWPLTLERLFIASPVGSGASYPVKRAYRKWQYPHGR